MHVLQTNRGWRLTIALVALIGTMSFIGGAAFAQQGKDDQPRTSAVQPLASSSNGGSIISVTTVRETSFSLTSSTTFVDIPGATVSTVIVPTPPFTPNRLFIATFSAESACSDTNRNNGWCSIRLMITGPTGTFEMEPAAGSDFAFDSSDGGTETSASWESHMVQRSFSVNTAGLWTIQAQQKVSVGTMTFRLDDWLLRVDQANLIT